MTRWWPPSVHKPRMADGRIDPADYEYWIPLLGVFALVGLASAVIEWVVGLAWGDWIRKMAGLPALRPWRW